MRLPQRVTNPCLAALIDGAGFASVDRFAEAVNARAWQMHGVRLAYDHVRVKRWISGGNCQYPEAVASVLSGAWAVPIPVGVIFPELRNGSGPIPAHLQAWVAARTVEDLSVFIRSDMLTRREMLAASITAATGRALTEPITRWLAAGSIGLPYDESPTPGQVGMSTVAGIEQATQQFAAADAAMGGGLSREAAVGQLRYAVDLASHGRFTEAVGNRLLATIAELAGMVGWMSHDVGMNGPAQSYFTYGLQAAHESRDERAPLLTASLLADLARQIRPLGHPDTGVRLVELALEQLPRDRRFTLTRSTLWNLKARMLASMGITFLPEVRNAINLSFDLFAQADEDGTGTVLSYASEAELAGVAASCYRDLAGEDRSLAVEAEEHVQFALAHRGEGFNRSKVFDQIGLARARFLQAEPDQGCHDGEAAIVLAATVATSQRVTGRLRELVTDSEPYADRPRVREFREKLHLAVSAA